MKKTSKSSILIILLIVILGGLMYVYFKDAPSVETNNNNETKINTHIVGKGNIEQTVTGAGEIKNSETEKLKLNKNRYYKETYAKENKAYKKGEKLLKYTNGEYLYAPYDLVVKSKEIPEKSGAKCNEGNYIEVVNIAELNLILKVDENQINQLKAGQEVEITINALENKTYKGKIKEINELGTYAANGSKFEIIISFENDGNIKLGMSANCKIKISEVKDAIIVPIEAVQNNLKEKYVIVQEENGTKNVVVETGLSNDAYVEIKSGLKGGENVQVPQKTPGNQNMQISQYML